MSDILAVPTQGYRYTVKQNDTLWDIARTAYGDPLLWRKIEAANGFLATRPPVSDGSPVIYTGDILIIPDLMPEIMPPADKTLNGRQDDELTILIEDKEIKHDSATIIRTMDTAADAVNFTIAWMPSKDKELDQLLLPYKYPAAEAFIGNNRKISGNIYIVKPSLGDNGSIVNLTLISKTKDAVDSTVNPPYEKNNITLESRAKELLNPLGLRAVFDVDTGGAFDRMTANYNNCIFDHLAEYAAQRGILISCTEKGELFFYRADTEADPVGTLKEGENFTLDFAGEYDGTKLYNVYKALADTPGGDAQAVTAIDNNIPKSRMLTFKADDTTDGNISKAAEWKRSRLYADALTNSIPVSGWKAPNGKIWEPGQIVILQSPTLFLPDGAKMIIRQVTLIYDAGGKSGSLDLVPVQVYSGEPIDYIWGVA
jgi:prophage tail gpP-like protein